MESTQHIAWHVKVFAVATFLPEYLRLSILLLPQVPPALTHSMKSLVNISKSSSDVCFRKDTLGWQAGRTGAAWGEENELGKSLHQPTRGISAYSQSFRLIWAMSFLWWGYGISGRHIHGKQDVGWALANFRLPQAQLVALQSYFNKIAGELKP